jgi:hypothetical protein
VLLPPELLSVVVPERSRLVATAATVNAACAWGSGVELPPPQAERINADAAAPASRVNELREICTMLPPMAFEKEMDLRLVVESAV